jgi:peptidoglycan/LPS O-acetylase OafA/YrhL
MHASTRGPAHARATASLTYQPALDGLRGVAVVAVLAFHAGFTWAPGGFLGVSAFFTLSGFLITSLLLTEWRATGHIGLRAFWARRFRRLLPASLLTLGGIVLFGAFIADANQLRDLRVDVIAALSDVANWRFVVAGQSYADLFAEPSPVQHFWSLAIEEQFYATFPLLVAVVLAVRRRPRLVLFAVLALLAAGSTVLMFGLRAPHSDFTRVYYGTDTRAVELLAGALLAVVACRPVRAHRRTERPLIPWIGVAALVALLAMWATTAQTAEWLYRGGFALHAALTVLVIAAAVRPGPVRAVLSIAPLRRLGVISYGVYLYHWPIYLWLSPERTGVDGWPLFGLRVWTTLTLAVLSYRFVESPIRSGARITTWRPWLVAPAGAAAVCVALVAVTAHPPAPAVVLSAAIEAPPPPLPPPVPEAPTVSLSLTPVSAAIVTSTTAPARSAPAKILVVGDSVAATLGRGLQQWGRTTGQARVWNVATNWCGIGRGGKMPMRDSGEECNNWGERWSQHLASFDPDVVVVLSDTWDRFDRKLPDWERFLGPEDPRFREWLRSEYAVATELLSSRGAKVAWLTIPCSKNADSHTQRLNNGVIRPVAVDHPAMSVIDLDAKLCPAGVFVNELDGMSDIRPDGAHFSDRSALWLAEWLGPRLLAPAPSPPRTHLR